mmetsp:Transcript_7932/g.23402  ORF Transcript_7932/g.23402 Transcript_7932/m.23402 type:complete len:485 (+) Transcript_7932:240-1694(+)|eukprot:CAMPEP_0206145614 /NCGR_PEP_ID=MMETSP1473-20131121/27949_1 /ASSEMBLY_ACC=CAM_ASM_001109 /TAXON_ID=1461547 /ORGANISM="Stichococcus sp, Strain RCC1054" /LENGTH=484 /DNA_ID=CAMNT_0053541887 /DNA_START=200 /DNA_END=1654 /DNA_ORIENTATION=+
MQAVSGRAAAASMWALTSGSPMLQEAGHLQMAASRYLVRQRPQLRQPGRRLQVMAATAAGGGSNARGQRRRVVITGLGVTSSVGNEVDTFYDSLLAGTSGVSRIEGFDTEKYSTQIAGEIRDFDPGTFIDKKSVRRLDKAIKYLLVAGKKALLAAGISEGSDAIKEIDVQRAGILIGSAMGGMDTFAAAITALHTQGHRKMNPFCIPFSIINMGGALLAMDLGFMGPNYPINTACATGNYCLLNAAQHIERGDADVMLAGGTEAAIIPSGIGGFIACKALSKRNDDPSAASRPWDKGRDGFVMGEGAGVLVLEELEHAKSRGAPILAEFLGGAVGCDAYHLTDPRPDGSGVRACIQAGLADAGVSAADVNYVNAHATSTTAGDLAEYRAITQALGEGGLLINSTKSMIGHLLGAAGAVEAVAVVKALMTGKVHPNINLTDPEDEVDLSLLVGSQAQDLDIKVALSNSFGFGGHNSCILMRKYEE